MPERRPILDRAFDFANDYFFWNHNIDYGRESGVRRFVFNLNQVYELPFGKGRKYLNGASRGLNAIAGGWQVAIASLSPNIETSPSKHSGRCAKGDPFQGPPQADRHEQGSH